MGKITNSSGFTMVEMLVTLAIVALLTALAIPQYQKYAASAKQAEAKYSIGQVFTAERNALLSGGNYTSCLSSIGVTPNYSPGARYYEFGLSKNAATQAVCGSTGNVACNQIPGPGACAVGALAGGEPITTYANAFSANLAPNSSLGLPKDADFPSVGVGTTAFSVGAVGNIYSGASRFDKWTIDSNKTVLHTQSGI